MKHLPHGGSQQEWLDEATRSSFARVMPRIEERYRDRSDPGD